MTKTAYLAIILFALLWTHGNAQSVLPGRQPGASLDPSHVLPTGMNVSTPYTDADDAILNPGRSSRGIHSAAMVSGFGIGGMGVGTMRGNGSVMQQLSVGYIRMFSRTSSNIEGTDRVASVTPAFLGVRYDFSQTRTSRFDWTHYVVTGAGPLMGIEYPSATDFFNTLEKMAFRWGGGAYAGIGTEVDFHNGVGAFAQLELDGFGFFSPLLGKSSYLGPSFSFGIQLAP